MAGDSGPRAVNSDYENGTQVDLRGDQETTNPTRNLENLWLQKFRAEVMLDPVLNVVGDLDESNIFKVPSSTKRTSPEHFEVQDTHLGLHNRDLDVSGPSEKYKILIAQTINLELQAHGSSWDNFVRHVVPDPTFIKLMYEAPNQLLNAAEIQHLLTLDALFLVVFFQHRSRRCATKELSTLMANCDHQRLLPESSLALDLVLVENQIPMELLVNVTTELCKMEGKDDAKEAMDLMLKEAIFFHYPFIHGNKERFMAFVNSYYSLERRNLQTCDHILDCVYRVVCHYDIPFPNYVKPTFKMDPMNRILSATNLREKGIHVEGTAYTMTDICFSSSRFATSAKLKLPQIEIFDHTVPLLRNLAVYEQIANNHRCRFRNYLHCMSHLMDGGEDVRLLSRCRVISNFLGNHDRVAASWSTICDGILVGNPDDKWYTMHHKIHQYCRKRRKALRRQFHAKFCSKPWRVISVLVATLILLFTFVQAYTAVVSANSLRPHFNW